MASIDPMRTQCVAPVGIAAELTAAGFEDPEEIGRGGFGVVYRCGQSALGRTVAVKVLTADLEPENLDRFVREQRAMGKLSGHPNIVNIFQVGRTASGRPYIVMQYHPHGSLEDRIRDDGPLGWAGRAAHRGEDRRRAGDGAPAWDAAPRRQARQHPAHRLRRAAADRLRHRAHRRRVRDVGRRDHRLARPSPRRRCCRVSRRRQRPTSTAWRRHCSVSLTGHAAFERRSGRAGGGAVPADHPAADAGPAPSRECPPMSARRSSRRWPATRPTGPRRPREFGNELRERAASPRPAGRRHGGPGVRRHRQRPGRAAARPRPVTRRTSVPRAPHAARAGHPVPPADGDAGAGGPGPADRRAARGPAAPAHRDPRARPGSARARSPRSGATR